VEQLVDGGLVKDLADIYTLKQETLIELERMGKKSAENLIAEIDRSRGSSLDRLIFALGIRFVGERTATILADHFGSLAKLAEAATEELEAVFEVGPKVAASIFSFFREPRNQKLIERLRKEGLQFEQAQKARKENKLGGKTFVLTGTLEKW